MRYFLRSLTYFNFVLFVLSLHSASAAEWGNLKGRFVVEGEVEETGKINITKDIEFCSKHDLEDETLELGENGALQNVVVYLYTRRGRDVDVHPDLQSADEPAQLDNEGCRFDPHVLFVRTGQKLVVHNSDEGIGHNTNVTPVRNPGFNQLIAYDGNFEYTFDNEEPVPVPVACNVHPWMNGYLVVRNNPYVAISGEDGSFEIKNIPAGEHNFVFWHEADGNLRGLQVGDEQADRRGRVELEIPAGETLEVGEIKVQPNMLGR